MQKLIEFGKHGIENQQGGRSSFFMFPCKFLQLDFNTSILNPKGKKSCKKAFRVEINLAGRLATCPPPTHSDKALLL